MVLLLIVVVLIIMVVVLPLIVVVLLIIHSSRTTTKYPIILISDYYINFWFIPHYQRQNGHHREMLAVLLSLSVNVKFIQKNYLILCTGKMYWNRKCAACQSLGTSVIKVKNSCIFFHVKFVTTNLICWICLAILVLNASLVDRRHRRGKHLKYLWRLSQMANQCLKCFWKANQCSKCLWRLHKCFWFVFGS